MEKIIWALILFWNVENYFAPFDFHESDTLHAMHAQAVNNAGQFRNWKAFSHKRDGMAKTICLVAASCGRFPDLIGLAEVENRWALNQLTGNTVLAAQDYGIVHKDSPDSRGIDVALLYRRSSFKPLSKRFIPIIVSSGNTVAANVDSALETPGREEHDTLRTREILYVKGVLRGYDTLHVFVNHWPSKLGGKAAQNHRSGIAEKLRYMCDSIAEESVVKAGIEMPWHGAKIVIMGDFNAGAGDSALEILERGGENSPLVNVNDSVPANEKKVYGSYKYKGEWSTIDRFYVSRYFVQDKEIHVERAEIFSHPFLLEADRTYLGVKPRRSFIGAHFNGGLSDHLPVILRIFDNTFHSNLF